MKTFSWLWSAPVLALVLAGAAHATILFSQTLRVGAGDVASCSIVNAGTKDFGVQVDLLDGNGAPFAEDEFSVSPGGANSKSFVGTTGNFQCRFSGVFSKRDVRASIEVLSGSGVGFGTIVTAPAQ